MSQSFCGHCGTRSTGGAFCASCGKPLPVKAGAPPPQRVPPTKQAPPKKPGSAQSWQAVVGDLPPAPLHSPQVTPGIWGRLPGLVLRHVLFRIPALALTILPVWMLHTYLVVVKHEGFNGSDHWTRFFVNLNNNGSASFLSFGLATAMFWSVFISFLRRGPVATLNTLFGAPLRCLATLFSKDPSNRLGLALGLGLVLLGCNYVEFSSQNRLTLSLGSLFLGMGHPGTLLGMLFGAALNSLTTRIPWLRGLNVGLITNSLLASLPLGFFMSWFFSASLTGKLGWLALIFVAYTLYNLYNQGKGGAVSSHLLLMIGYWWLLYAVLGHHAWADDGGWAEVPGSDGKMTVDNVIRWWTSVGSGPAIATGLVPVAGATIGALTPPLAPPKDGKDGKDPNLIIGYILQISADHFTLKAGTPASLSVAVWSVTAAGQQALASGAQISLALSGGQPGFQVSPSSGSGRMQTSLSWSGESPPSDSLTLVVTALAGGTTYSSDITLNLEAGYELVVNCSSNYPAGE